MSVLKLAAALDWSHSLRAGEEVKALAWPADSTRAAAAEVDAVEDASEGAEGAEDAPDALAPPFFFLPWRFEVEAAAAASSSFFQSGLNFGQSRMRCGPLQL